MIKSEQVEELIFYYPISPKIAITVNDKNNTDRIELEIEEVDKYNKAMVKASYESIFANDENVIKRYIGESE